MLLLAHPTGNTFSRAAARSFHAQGWLKEFDTCLNWNPNTPLARFLPSSLASELRRRSFTDVPSLLIQSHPFRELARLAAAGLPLSWLSRHELGPLSVDGIYRSFDCHVAARLSKLPGLNAVYAYEDGALSTFQAAERFGLRRIYDLPIGYWRAARQIFEEERELQPEWACTLTGLQDSLAKLARKDAELQLADLVVVPSDYVRKTLVLHGASSTPIAVVPFGSPLPLSEPPSSPSTGPLRVLYVGSLGQRKGLSYALDAIEMLGDQVVFTLIGRPTGQGCKPLAKALQRHSHIASLPHGQILQQMRQHDVLLFPTLFDGFGLVITEAFSQGLPVIATANSGAPECIRDGVEGFIVPIRDSHAIAECLQQLASNREQLAAMRQACLRRAAEMSWAGYEQALVAVVGQALSAAPSLA